MCDHSNFDAKVDVDRIVNRSDSDKILSVTFRAKIRIICRDCNTSFIFDAQKAYTEDNSQSLFVPIESSANFTPVIESPPAIPFQ